MVQVFTIWKPVNTNWGLLRGEKDPIVRKPSCYKFSRQPLANLMQTLVARKSDPTLNILVTKELVFLPFFETKIPYPRASW